MNNANLTKSSEPTFTLDKTPEKWYTKNSIMQTNLNAFDNDATANSALDYLYSNDNLNKTQSFLKNNGFPSAQEREYNKELYGVQEEEKNMQNLLKSKTNSILNPTLPNDTDRAFFKGLMGDEEEERDYQNQISVASQAQKDLQNAFQGTHFLKLDTPISDFSNDLKHSVNNNSNKANELGFVIVPNLTQKYDTTQYLDNKKLLTGIKNSEYNNQSLHAYNTDNPLNTATLGESIADNFKNIFILSKAVYQTFKNYANEKQKAAQRSIWKAGAEYYLRKNREYYTSAWMLEHALQDNPSDIWRGNDSRIAYLINNDSVYLNALDEAIKNSKDGTIDTDLKNIQFNDDDLYYSIHKATIHVNGYKQSNGKWIVHATLDDHYDFTELMTFMDNGRGFSTQASKGTVANDVAAVSQFLGAINPYHVIVDFYTTR